MINEKPDRTALGTVFLVVLIDLMGFGIVLPLLPFYAAKFQVSAIQVGFLYSIYSLAQLIFSPIWGQFSDRIGRRPIMLMSTFGAVLAYILFALSQSLWVLLFSRLLAGIMGGNISAAQAYVADVTTHEDRAKGMGLIGAAFGIGFVIGPALATLFLHLGTPLGDNRYALPGFFAAGLSFLSFLLVLLKLPESVKFSSNQDAERIQRHSIFTIQFWTAIQERKDPLIKVALPSLILCTFLMSIGHSTLYSAFPLFCSSRLNLNAEKVGLQFAAMGLIAVLIQGGLIRILVKRFGERKLFLVGSILMALGLALIPWAKNPSLLLLFLCLMAIGGSLNGPTLTSLISKEAAPERIGAVMGSSQGISALGRVIGPTWGGFLFSYSYFMPFTLTSALLLIMIFIGFEMLR